MALIDIFTFILTSGYKLIPKPTLTSKGARFVNALGVDAVMLMNMMNTFVYLLAVVRAVCFSITRPTWAALITANSVSTTRVGTRRVEALV